MERSLLQVVQNPPITLEGAGKQATVLMLEYAINQTLEPPFLVTASAKYLFWISKKIQPNVIRAGLRDFPLNTTRLFRTIVSEISSKGSELGYANLHPLTEQGILDAYAYVDYFMQDPGDSSLSPDNFKLDVICGLGCEFSGASLSYGDTSFQVVPVDWVPDDAVLVVPANRAFLGDLHLYGDSLFSVVVHNPFRGLGIARLG